MIARILTEAILPKKNDSTLQKYIRDWGIPELSDGRYELSDGKPGTWFVKELEENHGTKVLVCSFSAKVDIGYADYIRAYKMEWNFDEAALIYYARFGDFTSYSDPDREKHAKINSTCVRKCVQDLAKVSTVEELYDKMKLMYWKSHQKEVWR